MSPNTYLQSILSYFTSIDIAKLRYYLKDEYTYQDTAKEIFLAEVESIFEAYKNSGDTELIIYKGACAGKRCDNCGKMGYRFVGNYSKNYIDLLFEIEGDDITDIYYCAQFNTFDKIDDLGTKAHIEINLDDQVTFHKTPEYWSKVYAATKAWSEIITTPPRQIDYQDLCYWVDKHSITDSLIGSYDINDETMKWTAFSSLYADLKEIRSYIARHIEDFSLANYQAKQIQSEQHLIDWLVKYEDIHAEASTIVKYCFVKGNGYFSLYAKNPSLFYDTIFDETFRFIKYFQDHFDDVFLKYSTYTDQENSILYNTGGGRSHCTAVFSLKFHLAHRKAMEELGTDVPFYLNKRG